jgi:hypothetical protein
MKIHGQYEIPKPSAAAYYDWGDPPFGGAWHSWKAGYKYDEIYKEIRQPLRDENVFICGEAYSLKQGWAEGALQTAEEVLCNYIDRTDRLEKLDWLKTMPKERKPAIREFAAYTGYAPESLRREREELTKLTDEQAGKWIRSDSKHRMLIK